ncbi:MAG: hypothetical protein IKQ17_02425 [Kiritimatiellae bacterium]|nr:hypothetical protein [Kiritimatiellia bacterium]
MTEIAKDVKKHRPMLRNAKINYKRGTFFVTIQAAFNKTIFGAIVGEKCVLNELGKVVEEALKSLGGRYDGVEIDEYVVMPNHIHFIIKIAGVEARHPEKAVDAASNPNHDLGFVVGRFKSWVSKVYRDMVAEGKAVDVGATPWQRDFWDKLVTTREQLEGYRRYIRENPAKWTRDRFGAVTSYTHGNVALLNAQLVGFVASQGAYASELKPRLLWARYKIEETGPCPREKSPVVSTFTSAQERAVLAKVLASGRRFVKVYPGGIPQPSELDAAIVAACDEGRGLLISPAAPGTGINKQRAVWCNEYILKNAVEVWAGDITPGHTLASLVEALKPKEAGAEARHPNLIGVAGHCPRQ